MQQSGSVIPVSCFSESRSAAPQGKNDDGDDDDDDGDDDDSCYSDPKCTDALQK